MSTPLPARIDALAADARAAFLRHGWPRQREESWRYTSLRHLRGDELAAPRRALTATTDGSAAAAVGDGAAQPRPEVAALPASFAGLGVGPGQALALDAALVEGRLQQLGADSGAWRGLGSALADADADAATDGAGLPVGLAGTTASDQGAVARNTALFFDACTADRGAAVRVRGRLEAPLRLGVGAAADARVAITLDAGAEAVIVELHAVGEGDSTLHVPVTEVRLGVGARLRHVVVLCGAPATTQLHTAAVEVGPSARYELHALLLGGHTTRLHSDVQLVGDGAECAINGLIAAKGHDHADLHAEITHRGRHTESRQLVKCLCDDAATSVVRGLVRIEKGARHAAARQLLRNLLLAPKAKAFSKPHLEIENEEVRAQHGATTGELDAGQLFYLTARGLTPDAARALLIGAFAQEVLAALPDPALAAWVRALFASRLGAQAMATDAQ